MPRTPEAQSFFHAVYSAVQQIPPGKVTSYGHIAKLIGTPQRPRQVGVCLKHLPPSPTQTNSEEHADQQEYASRFNHDTVPWQRVINAKGVISPRSQPSGALNQAAALELEGVTVTTGALGELMVDFAAYGWFPASLPSDVDGGDIDEDFDSQNEDDT
ncbi:6-O-methylguanine DNA methyltransferase [Podospora fimiseda]|uniref:6-O-methylguanine DNA methyltransferase n=1 Tax=Podospora fimiseda TaxID=252190 RepID=A0AAN7BLJ0_9PEZI|nr:6-O-methylguanine DNA methyltransferase [Podospora fimiseda]